MAGKKPNPVRRRVPEDLRIDALTFRLRLERTATLVILESFKMLLATSIPQAYLLFRGFRTRCKLGNTNSSMIQCSLISGACAFQILCQQVGGRERKNGEKPPPETHCTNSTARIRVAVLAFRDPRAVQCPSGE